MIKNHSFGSMSKMFFFMKMVFPLNFSYFPSKKNHWEIKFFVIVKKISKSEFFATACKRQVKITLWSCVVGLY